MSVGKATERPKAVAFMVMPFGTKSVDHAHADPSAPAQVDFDALWEKVYKPALAELDYEPVRADQDVGALIIDEMIRRLTIADLVVADVSLPNANVYYELGIRHAAAACGSVTVSAEWARPLFDLASMRQLRFPLSDGSIPDDQAKIARELLVGHLRPLIDGISPVYAAVSGYPGHIEPSVLEAFRSTVSALSAFDAEVRAVHLMPAGERGARARQITQNYCPGPSISDAVALRLLGLLAETAEEQEDWAFVLEFIGKLSPHLSSQALVLDTRALALGKHHDYLEAVAQLQQVIDTHGGTSERYGQLGGRYKNLMTANAGTPDRRRYLNKAIESYEKAMRLDLNDFYPSSNLPRLYRERGDEEDLLRAADVAVIASEACQRALDLGLPNDWIKATLLGLAFYRGDVKQAQKLCDAVIDEGPGVWQLQSTIEDLRRDVEHQQDPAVQAQLTAIVDELQQLLPQQPAGPVTQT